MENEQLARLVSNVLQSSKYRNVSEDFIKDIGVQELLKRRSLKEAIKATKNKLHQVGGAYLDIKPSYLKWLDHLKEAFQSSDRIDFLQACKKVMSHHSSTRERLPILEEFYAEMMSDLPPIRSVLDIACGLNPLSIPWMPIAEKAEYYAFDIYRDMMGFLDGFLALIKMEGKAEACDVIRFPPTREVDVAFILKSIPCLEQVDRASGQRLVDSVKARHLFVSFPIHTLGGRDKGMALNYETRFHEMVSNANWMVKRFAFSTEIVFRISK
ncbi:MAG: 16S rRNA methyltransferase [Acidobacteria bacterium]|nr:16S rRNA methyltransferase [Acidobacteriota bacterium]